MQIQMQEGQLGNVEGTIKNCYNTNIVKGQGYIGGILGTISSPKTRIVNCFNTGDNIKNEIVGYATFDVTENCYSKDDIFTVNDLGEAFRENKDNTNDGYPILYWE